MTLDDVRAYISNHKYGVFSTVSPEGKPQSAVVGIVVTPDLEIVFDTLNTSRKFRNMEANPACSFVIGWENDITVQYEGVAEEIRGEELAGYRKLYLERFPDGNRRVIWPAITYVRVRPRWIRYCDYKCDPALMEEFAIER